uniref:Uncharacterized protein n=1 Tax=Glossina brevipalpis TaxID=37001 RepID=A0A1A9W4T1_9MUSC
MFKALRQLLQFCAVGVAFVIADDSSSYFDSFGSPAYNKDYESNYRNVYITENSLNEYLPAYDNKNNNHNNNLDYLSGFKNPNNYYEKNSFTHQNNQQSYNYVPSIELEPPKRDYVPFTADWSSGRSNSYPLPRENFNDSSSFSKHNLRSNYYLSPSTLSGDYLSSTNKRPTIYEESKYSHILTTPSSTTTNPDYLPPSAVTTPSYYLRSSAIKSNEHPSYSSVELFKPVYRTSKTALADTYVPPKFRDVRILDQSNQYLPPSTPRSIYGISTSTASINIPLPLYSAPSRNQRKDTGTFRDDGYHYDAPTKTFEF